jgi:hypothetical protein
MDRLGDGKKIPGFQPIFEDLSFLRLRHFQLSGCSWTFAEDFTDPGKISALNGIRS